MYLIVSVICIQYYGNLELFLFYAHAMMLYDALHAIDRGLALV